MLVEGSASRHYRHAIVLAEVTQAHQRPAKPAHDVEAVASALLAQDRGHHAVEHCTIPTGTDMSRVILGHKRLPVEALIKVLSSRTMHRLSADVTLKPLTRTPVQPLHPLLCLSNFP